MLLLPQRFKSSCFDVGVGMCGTLCPRHVHVCMCACGREKLRPGRDFPASVCSSVTFHGYKIQGEEHFIFDFYRGCFVLFCLLREACKA